MTDAERAEFLTTYRAIIGRCGITPEVAASPDLGVLQAVCIGFIRKFYPAAVYANLSISFANDRQHAGRMRTSLR